MIVAFSTSSPLASVALFQPGGELYSEMCREAPMAASGACIEMLRELKFDPATATGFLADLGPGSFTGVKVGVMLAKAFGYDRNVPVSGVSSFDLIDPVGPAFVPCRKGEFLLRTAGEEPRRVLANELVGTGYGAGVSGPRYPMASRFAAVWQSLTWVDPILLLPNYVLEPNISTPKKPPSVGGRPG